MDDEVELEEPDGDTVRVDEDEATPVLEGVQDPEDEAVSVPPETVDVGRLSSPSWGRGQPQSERNISGATKVTTTRGSVGVGRGRRRSFRRPNDGVGVVKGGDETFVLNVCPSVVERDGTPVQRLHRTPVGGE